MAKVGIEVEGRLKGTRTLFMGADEYLEAATEGTLADTLRRASAMHLYVSDNSNRLHLDVVSAFLAREVPGLLATVDVTAVTSTLFKMPNLTVMLRYPFSIQSYKHLRPTDQVKFELPYDHNMANTDTRNVLVFPAANYLALTEPHEFAGDVEL